MGDADSPFEITVRDGRIGRDETLVTDEGGEVLATFGWERPIDLGERLTLPNGDEVVVLGLHEKWTRGETIKTTVHVGDTWATPH